jgi:predicted porin
MNKKLVTLAVAAALVAPAAAMADATLYGKMHVALDYIDVENGYDGWDLNSYSSRLGVKGSEDLGNGLKAIYQIELDVPISNRTGTVFDADRGDSIRMRNSFVGLSSQWGTVLAGRHDTPFKISTGKLDLFGDTLADFANIVGFEDLRADSTIMYISPSFNGFQVAGAVIPTGGVTGRAYPQVVVDGFVFGNPAFPVLDVVNATGNPEADSINEGWSLGAIYNNGPLYASLAYESLSSEMMGAPGNNLEDYEKWRVGLGLLDWNGFTLSGVYENWSDYLGVPDADSDLWQIQAGYAFGNNMIKAAYGENDPDVSGVSIDAAKSWVVGFDHSFSKRTTAYVLYTDVDDDDGVLGGSYDAFSLGMIHSF